MNANNKKKETTFRTRLSISEKRSLENIAKNHKLYYGKTGSISALIKKIADGSLIIKKTALPQKIPTTETLIKLVISAYADVRGTIHVITNEIANSHGNIYDTDFELKDGIAKSNFLVSLNSNQCLARLLEKLHQVKVASINEFNSPEQIHSLMIRRQFNYKSRELFQLQPLLIDIRCLIAIKVVVTNEAGKLAEITRIIATKQFLIESIFHDNLSVVNFTVLKFFLMLNPSNPESRKDIYAEVTKINELIESLNEIEGVEKASRISILDV